MDQSHTPRRSAAGLTLVCLVLLAGLGSAWAQAKHSEVSTETDVELAQQLANPVADLISVPFQSNFDYNGGLRRNGSQYLLNIQPVIPFHLSNDWNLITRTILPVTKMNNVFPETVGGVGDILQSFFLSPRDPINGIIVGAGPVVLYPTATDRRLGANQFAAGPTAVALKQSGPWTVGVLANHLWGMGSLGRNGQEGGYILGLDGYEAPVPASRSARVNATFMQPFVSYTFPTRTTLTLSSEAAYDWTGRRWSVPVLASVSQLLLIGSQPVSLSIGGKYWAERPTGAPLWGARFTVTMLFPK